MATTVCLAGTLRALTEDADTIAAECLYTRRRHNLARDGAWIASTALILP